MEVFDRFMRCFREAHHLRQGITALALVLSLSACSDYDNPFDMTWMEGTSIPAKASDKGTPMYTPGTTPDSVVISTTAENLPDNIMIPAVNLYAVPVTTALQAVLFGTDVSLSWNANTLGTHLVTVMNLKGTLPKVVEKICDAANVSCDYRHGSIELSEKEAFVFNPPTMAHPPSSKSSFSVVEDVGNKKNAELLPDPIIIDKDGVRSVTLLDAGAGLKKNFSGPTVVNTSIQNGFSNAFGKRLKTSGSPALKGDEP